MENLTPEQQKEYTKQARRTAVIYILTGAIWFIATLSLLITWGK